MAEKMNRHGKPLGRPRAFAPEAYRRILIHLASGKSLREASEAISESDGLYFTRQTVWRAAHFYPPYDSPQYREIAEAIGFSARPRALYKTSNTSYN